MKTIAEVASMIAEREKRNLQSFEHDSGQTGLSHSEMVVMLEMEGWKRVRVGDRNTTESRAALSRKPVDTISGFPPTGAEAPQPCPADPVGPPSVKFFRGIPLSSTEPISKDLLRAVAELLDAASPLRGIDQVLDPSPASVRDGIFYCLDPQFVRFVDSVIGSLTRPR